MHGHMPPQQHPGMHPPHQPPPHLTHLTNMPPHSIQRDHPVNRLNNARHHHPRGVDHQAPGMAPHLPIQVPPPPHQPHQSQNARKPPGPPYFLNGTIHGGLPKPLPLTSPHLHPSPPGLGVGQPPQPLPPQHQHPGTMPLPSVVSGNHPAGPGGKLPYGMGGGPGGNTTNAMGQHQPPVSVHVSVPMTSGPGQAPPPIPVVSAATSAGMKTRHIPSSTDHKNHHHGHSTVQTNGNSGPGSKGTHHQTSQSGLAMDKTKSIGGICPSGGNRHHHNHHHNSQQQQQHLHQPHHPQQHQQQQQQITNDSPLPKDSSATIANNVSALSAAPTVASVAPVMTTQTEASSTTAVNGGALSTVVPSESNAVGSSQPAVSSESIEALANIKEKTTMCLVNELARYNKIQHQYRLTGESGPAHKKHFTVTLKLGDEEYTAEGASIKKAQHKAAGDAIAATKYKHPPARTNRRTKTGTKGNVSSFTPTVELNALAMKRGEPTVYQVKAVPVPVSRYGPANAVNGGTGTQTAGAGRRSVDDKLSSGVGHPPGMGYGGAGRYDLDGTGTGAPKVMVAGGRYWCRMDGSTGHAAGVGGRGGIGGFHPGHQQQQQQQQQPQQHHHLRDDHQHRQHTAHHYHPNDGYGGHGSSGTMAAVQEFYKATLRVGERTFLGEGHTPQAARHDAAARALEVLKPLTAEGADGKGKSGEALSNGDGSSGDDESPADSGDPNAELKSPISLVHEIAVQRSLSVVFEVISEKGPPHMTVFVTQCKVGTILTEGEGTGKKLSKKRAAEKMLEELRKLQKAEQQSYASPWGDGNAGSQGAEKRKSGPKASAIVDGATAKKKVRNLIKEKSLADVSEKENPISRLMQIQQARKEKQPVYTLVENDKPNVGRRRQFTIEVNAGGRQATGVGMTKKAAKWSAAEALLVELGYAPETKVASANVTASDGSANKENQSSAANDLSPPGGKRSRKVKFQDEPANGVSAANRTTASAHPIAANQGKGECANESMNDSIASNDSMGTNSSGVSSASSAVPKPDMGAKKEQLLYLAQLLKFEVQFSDFPKGNHGEYLTLVILSTEPPQLCHGSGASLQESHDEAARGALEILSKIGLDNVKPKAPANSTIDDTVTKPSATATVPSSGTTNSK